MTRETGAAAMARNVTLYPWFRFCKNLLFWQATWFLYFQNSLSAAEAVLLYAVYDVATTALEVPSGYMSDRLGRRVTLIFSALAGLAGLVLLATGGGFPVFVAGQACLGASMAFASGTDSALLFESLAAEGQGDDVEMHEVRAWRFSFVALALSAISGGAAALWSPALPFYLSAVAFAGAVVITLYFVEPPHAARELPQGAELVRFGALRGAFRQPVLRWLFLLGLVMYGYSHIPFVFGQPFILEALKDTGFEPDAPLVSGVVTAIMMVISVLVSLSAPQLRRRIGLRAMLLFAFGLQIVLAGVLALTNDVLAIAFLFLRMVPDSLSTPFITARIQPLLDDAARATFLSLKSFAGRLAFAATLWLAARSTTDAGQMSYSEIQTILGWYAAGGLAVLLLLLIASRKIAREELPAKS